MPDKIIQLNEDLIKNNLKDLVRNSVEETLYELLEHEADELINAEKYEREYSWAVKPPFQNAGYRRSRDGVPPVC